MRFERENKKPIDNATEKQIRRQLSFKPAGDNTFAVLESADGSYVQMLGGGVACCLEWRDQKSKRHYRAYLKSARVPWKVPSRIGGVLLEPQEHLWIDDVIEVFCSFRGSRPFPPEIFWRDVTEELAEHGVRRPGEGPNDTL